MYISGLPLAATPNTSVHTQVSECGVLGVAARGRPKKTWNEVVQEDLRDVGLNREAANFL